MTLDSTTEELQRRQTLAIKTEDLGEIFAAIPPDYQIIGPVKEKWAMNLSRVSSFTEMAIGYGAVESPGVYRLATAQGALDLSKIRPMNSPKFFMHRPRELLYETKKNGDGSYAYTEPERDFPKTAFFGLCACDVSGLQVLDKTFTKQFSDPAYEARRRDTIIVGTNCFEPGNNCFCSTYNTGPGLRTGFDIGLSYFGDRYLVDIATETGARIMAGVKTEPAPSDLVEEKTRLLEKARGSMQKAFNLKKAVETLNSNYDHPYWREPSARCLSCANCINVCPTCYCYQVEDNTSIDASRSTRTRVWDACQHLEFAAVHGGNFRPARRDRLRQWVNHKINWTIEQYGCSGCVGCGRCVTWCPTAIDITEPIFRLGGREIGLAA